MDTVREAKQERTNQGPWETELSFGGETDLLKCYTECDKNPDHLNFVPIDELTVDHLPAGCKDKDLVDLVRAMSNLTVRLSVEHVSEWRPKTFPGSDKTYPYYGKTQRKMLRVGTAWVYNVTKIEDEKYLENGENYQEKYNKYPDKVIGDNRTCECKECLNSPTPKTQFAYIQTLTAAHVVYDDSEGRHTTCHLFFDRGDMIDDCIGVATLCDMSRMQTDVLRDRCEITYVTHDLELADKLINMIGHWKLTRERVDITHTATLSKQLALGEDPAPDAWHGLTIIVSHPHGCSKQVSFGHYTDIHEAEGGWIKYFYTTATCPGSSGAHISVMGREWSKFWANHIHCGAEDGFNFSGDGLD